MALRRTKRKAGRKDVASNDADAPDAAHNPSTQLLMADIVMRVGSTALRHFVEHKFLKGRFGPDTARNLMSNRSLGKTLTSVAIAKFATRSVPGAALVGTSILAKTLYERGKSRRKGRTDGDQPLIEPPEDK